MINLTKFILTSLLLGLVYCDPGPILVAQEKVECARVMCRMYCVNGFKRNENGCEYCQCNESPKECPQLNCERSCSNGYRKDYSGCQTCECEKETVVSDNKCLPVNCALQCQYGFQRDENGCDLCSCNSCPARACRMYCMFGFKRDPVNGCEICECDWTPVAEKIQCDERIPCPRVHVCNLKLKLCEAVNPDQVNWFLYDFEIESDMFKDKDYVQTFKNGFIRNVAAKYGLEITQIAVSSVEDHGLTSFQIMPFFNENMEVFENKMDQIDIDLNTHEFRSVKPAVTDAIDDPTGKSSKTWCQKFRSAIRSKAMFFVIGLLLIFIMAFLAIMYFIVYRRHVKNSKRSESKTDIYNDTSYALAPSDDEHHQSVNAPDGTKYIVVETDDTYPSKDKRAMV